jgi:hypothetical protein
VVKRVNTARKRARREAAEEEQQQGREGGEGMSRI